MKPGDIYTHYHKGHGVPYLILLLSSDKEPGWETSEEIWRCAQFQIGSKNKRLLGAQIVLYTKSELQEMTRRKALKRKI